MSEEAAEALEAAKRELEATRARLDQRIVENADGTLIVKLVVPVRLGNDELHRITLRPVRVRDVRAMISTPEAQRAIAYADRLISPQGAFDELASEEDFDAAMRAVERALGKFRTAGRAS